MTAPPEKEAAAPGKDTAAVEGLSESLNQGQDGNRSPSPVPRRDRFHRAAAAALREVFNETGDVIALARALQHEEAAARLEGTK